ncbi:hypothetical protein BGZ76_011723 [Entomortierella beljakovae]|nr:hypothetical protein BGZ76_011723 [Entomortierella beljakovae]
MAQYLTLDKAYWKTFISPDRYSYDHIPDLSNKVAIVTGANSGIGYATTVGLATNGCHVFMACRSETKCRDAMVRIKEEIREKYPDAQMDIKLDFLHVDMNDLRKVYASANEFLEKGLPLHILINNSGIGGTPWAASVDGIEQQFAINYLGPFTFTMALLDRIVDSQPSRIVTVSSVAYESFVSQGVNFEEIRRETSSNLSPFELFARSKFANILFAKALARRLKNEIVYCNVVYPGIVQTDMTCNEKSDQDGDSMIAGISDRLIDLARQMFSKVAGISAERGALTQLYCATSPEIENRNVRGKFFIPIGNEIRTNPIMDSVERQEKLWRLSEEIVKQKLKEEMVRNAQRE